MRWRTVVRQTLLLAAAGAACGSEEVTPVGPEAAQSGRLVESPDGIPIYYTVEGEGNTTLVLVHGWSCDRTYWSEQIPHYRDRYRIVSVDVAGHGNSGGNRQEWTLPSLGEDVRTVVEDVGAERVILIGHSMGGPVSLEAAARIPERVIGVIGVDSLHDADFKYDQQEFQQTLSSYRQDFQTTCMRFVGSMFIPDSPVELKSRIQQDMCATDHETAVSLLEAFFTYDLAGSMSAVQAPIFCINAGTFPTNVEGNRQYNPDFDAFVMDGVGHFLMLERPAEFNALLDQALERLLDGQPDPQQ